MHASAFLWQELATLGGAGCHVAVSDTHLVESESQ
jgi:hypothetical protein